MSRHDAADLAAIRILERLVAQDAIEFVSTRGVSSLAGGVSTLLVRQQPGPRRGAALAGWLMDQLEVRELFVDDDELEAIVGEVWDADADEPREATVARREDLEALLRAEPDALEHRLVYGDWLQAQRDPYGELITRQIAAAQAPEDPNLARAAAVYLVDHLDAVFGRLAEYLDVVVRVRWRGGFIESATIGRQPDDRDVYQGAILLGWLLEHRAAMLLRELELQHVELDWARSDYAAMLAVVLAQPRPCLRRLSVGDARELRGETGPLVELADKLPSLEILELHTRECEFEPLRHPNLRRLVWSSWSARQAAMIGAAELPRLEQLVLGGVDERSGRAWAELPLPSLRSLKLPGRVAVLELLGHARWAEQLEQLDLSHGSLTDGDLSLLTRRRWPALRRLDLSHNALGPAAAEALAGLGVELVLGEQRPSEDDDWEPLPGDDDEDEDGYYDDVGE